MLFVGACHGKPVLIEPDCVSPVSLDVKGWLLSYLALYRERALSYHAGDTGGFMQDTLVIQRATIDDVTRITEHRRLMFVEEGHDPARVDASLPLFVEWATEQIAAGRYIGLLALDGDTLAASAGLWRMPFPPGPLNLTISERAYILNVYTDPAYRRRGLARRLVAALVDEARALGLNVIELHASKAGRPIYEGLGFQPTNQMRQRF
jgi:GNAT superfamily N-acetyltransferase